MSRKRPRVEPDTRLAALRGQLARAEERMRHWCSASCFHPVLSKDPPPCAHPDATLCEMAQRRVESLRGMIAREEARLAS